jgi:hypothetical protein
MKNPSALFSAALRENTLKLPVSSAIHFFVKTYKQFAPLISA